MTTAQVYTNGVCAGVAPTASPYVRFAGSYNVIWRAVAWENGILALPSDNSISPIGLPANDPAWHFITPGPTTLTSVHIKADPVNLTSLNTIVNGSTDAVPTNVYLFVNEAYVATLAVIPAGNNAFDLFSSVSLDLAAGADIQFVFDLTTAMSGAVAGTIGNFLACFGFS